MKKTLFDSQDFIKNSQYDGDDLGAVIKGQETVFKVWAPTAKAVKLNLYREGAGDNLLETIPMCAGDKGIWSSVAACGHGTYYTFSVTADGRTRETVDPYAKAAGVNGERAMVVDLARTDPPGFENDRFIKLAAYSDAVIWEVHVRDFSNRIQSAMFPGKYLAFTETGLKNSSGVPVGIDYLKWLGVTHVHLQPVFDYASVDEAAPGKSFNWGYDPANYNVPEGGYSTDPFNGETRIREFKQMVQSLHSAGIGVVMDVVYNHTYSLDSCFQRTVPDYYYRADDSGKPSDGSGCGNETASERYMFRKYMVDSVRYWAREYHVDGFRFDLMALHDTDTMQAVETALHRINPGCLIYGEPWTGGNSALPASKQTTADNLGRIRKAAGAAGGIAVFDDGMRDALKGDVFKGEVPGYISGAATEENAEKIMAGLAGDGTRIHYMSCHDNLTLRDKLARVKPDADGETLAAMTEFGATVLMLSNGPVLFLAGEEMLRSKAGESNSYNAPDWVNNIDWEALRPGSPEYRTAAYYKDLIALRKKHAFLRDAMVKCSLLQNNAISAEYSLNGVFACAVINPSAQPVRYRLTGNTWEYLLGGSGSVRRTVLVPGGSIVLLQRR